MAYSDVVGTAGFVLSLGAIGWQVKTHRLEQPQLAVQLRVDVHLNVGISVTRTCHIGVTNYGNQAITIDEVGVMPEDPSFGQITVRRLRGDGAEVGGEAFPVRIEGHDAKEWEFDGRLIQEWYPQGMRVRAFAQRYFPEKKGQIGRHTVMQDADPVEFPPRGS